MVGDLVALSNSQSPSDSFGTNTVAKVMFWKVTMVDDLAASMQWPRLSTTIFLQIIFTRKDRNNNDGTMISFKSGAFKENVWFMYNFF